MRWLLIALVGCGTPSSVVTEVADYAGELAACRAAAHDFPSYSTCADNVDAKHGLRDAGAQ